ncbi:MAG TPA: N-acetyltransferase [Thermoplasmata archaeon]
MIIRPANEGDIVDLLAIEQDCFGDEKFTPETIRAFIEREDGIVLVAIEGSTIVGSAMCMFSERLGEGRIVSVAALKGSRSKGIGKGLLEECERIFRSRNLAKYTLEVETSNEAAIRLYLSHGYEVIGIIQDYYSFGRHAYLMEKKGQANEPVV